MAKLVNVAITILHILFIALPRASNAQNTEKAWVQNLNQGEKEKRAMLHFYVQNLVSGESMTVYEVAKASITSHSPTMFGDVFVLDDPVTADTDINSEKLGRLQGLAALSDLRVTALAMNLVLYITTGEYDGRTIVIAGRNQFYNETREMAVVGGTGIFREASGYAITNTVFHDKVTNNSVIEYKLYVRYLDGCDAFSRAYEQELHATP